MINTYYNIPVKIRAGDYYELLLQYSDFPTNVGYTPILYLRGASSLDITGTIVDDKFRFELTSGHTSILLEGTYRYSVTLKINGQRTTVSTGWISIEPDLATSGAKISHAETMLKAIEAVLEGRVTDDIVSMSIAGRSITKIPINDLMVLRANYMKELHILKGGSSAVRTTVPIVFGKIS
jgi:hypothetical protein